VTGGKKFEGEVARKYRWQFFKEQETLLDPNNVNPRSRGGYPKGSTRPDLYRSWLRTSVEATNMKAGTAADRAQIVSKFTTSKQAIRRAQILGPNTRQIAEIDVRNQRVGKNVLETDRILNDLAKKIETKSNGAYKANDVNFWKNPRGLVGISWLGRVATFAGIASDAYNIYTATDRAGEASRVAGAWIGSVAFAPQGAFVGAWIGAGFGPPGIAIGGIVGGIGSSILGYNIGGQYFTDLYNLAKGRWWK
jgi:hypothetical protein